MENKIDRTDIDFVLCGSTESGSRPSMGTWKLNESKSKLNPDMGKNHTVIYAAEGDSVKITVDGVNGKGKATHSEWTGNFDGRITQSPEIRTQACGLIKWSTIIHWR